MMKITIEKILRYKKFIVAGLIVLVGLSAVVMNVLDKRYDRYLGYVPFGYRELQFELVNMYGYNSSEFKELDERYHALLEDKGYLDKEYYWVIEEIDGGLCLMQYSYYLDNVGAVTMKLPDKSSELGSFVDEAGNCYSVAYVVISDKYQSYKSLIYVKGK